MTKQVDVVKKAWKNGLIIPSFNIPYLPMVKPIIQAVADQESFAFIATAQVEWETLESKGPREVMDEFQKWNQPEHVRIHLDHIPSIHGVIKQPMDYYRVIVNAIETGYPSVMIDGTHEGSLDDNINVTKRIVDYAHEQGVFVEAEVGCVFCYEVDKMPSYEEIFKKRIGFTTEEDVKRMVQETGCDWISVAAGNVHGVMYGKARFEAKIDTRLDIEHIEKLNAAAGVPLVIHGGSGISSEDIIAAMKHGIAKTNVAKAVRQCYQHVMKERNNVVDAQQAVYECITELIRDYFQISGISKIINES